MTVEIGFDPIVGRKMRMEDWAGQGVSTLKELRSALAAGDEPLATDLLDIYVWESVSLYHGYVAWMNDWIVKIGEREKRGLWRYLVDAHRHVANFHLHTLPLEVAAAATGDVETGVALDEAGAAPSLIQDGRTIPLEPWLAAGEVTRVAVQSHIGARRWTEAADALEQLHREHKPVHDAFSDIIWLWMTMLADAWGEEAMIALIADSGDRLRAAGLKALPSMPVETHVRHLAAAMRGHRSGPGEEGDISVTEDDEKYVIAFDACGSGGRMRRRGTIDGLPARQDAPFGFGSTKRAHPMSWGLKDVPYYCLHCAAYAEMQSIDLIGYPSRVALYDPDHDKPCAWAFYKDRSAVPERFFDRVGKRKPAKC